MRFIYLCHFPILCMYFIAWPLIFQTVLILLYSSGAQYFVDRGWLPVFGTAAAQVLLYQLVTADGFGASTERRLTGEVNSTLHCKYVGLHTASSRLPEGHKYVDTWRKVGRSRHVSETSRSTFSTELNPLVFFLWGFMTVVYQRKGISWWRSQMKPPLVGATYFDNIQWHRDWQYAQRVTVAMRNMWCDDLETYMLL
jgi:hypothetical protein